MLKAENDRLSARLIQLNEVIEDNHELMARNSNALRVAQEEAKKHAATLKEKDWQVTDAQEALRRARLDLKARADRVDQIMGQLLVAKDDRTMLRKQLEELSSLYNESFTEGKKMEQDMAELRLEYEIVEKRADEASQALGVAKHDAEVKAAQVAEKLRMARHETRVQSNARLNAERKQADTASALSDAAKAQHDTERQLANTADTLDQALRDAEELKANSAKALNKVRLETKRQHDVDAVALKEKSEQLADAKAEAALNMKALRETQKVLEEFRQELGTLHRKHDEIKRKTKRKETRTQNLRELADRLGSEKATLEIQALASNCALCVGIIALGLYYLGLYYISSS
ncbi:hypothetical protein BDY21DRAFT_423899 [Lineolata rhizophorae]|uniref:Uncharacterized protein n=1 Tax=Lineolata rhizophorae TaxID=578093 RepID=A0A6A6NSC9_9PEZI|nr:hypothetical protein BDY21DRAFT_423899 [Lineolata rhizophorae]